MSLPGWIFCVKFTFAMILIVDDDKTVRMSLRLVLMRNGYEVDCASSPEEALGFIRAKDYSVILMDMNYSRSTSGEEGLHLLRQTAILSPGTPVILITAWGSIELAVEGMRRGAFDFLTKPFSNQVLLQRVETAMALGRGEEKAVEPDNSQSDGLAKGTFNRCGIIGGNAQLKTLLSTVERIASTDAPVLILGENGTGKELIANAIHENSRRKDNPFIKVNLGGVSRSLFESEMFGHVKGAFTGASGDRKGSFELADKGTIFLDEIGDLDAAEQVKLLRVLQEHTFQALGDSNPRKTDIRVVCATNADLETLVREGKFREDLFYRINLITLRLPSLRERRDDIPALVRHFIEIFSEKHGIARPEISSEAMSWLTGLPYPGNIRELKNMVERAVIVRNGEQLEKDDFPYEKAFVEASAGSNGATLEDMERRTIEEAVGKYDGNISKAAAALGISRQKLYRLIDRYGIKY